MRDDPEVINVREEERIDTARLEPYLRERLTVADGSFAVRQFGGGHANLTYLVRFGETEYVLRRPPLGPLAPRSHDMRREHAVLSKLFAAFPLAPQSYLLCTDRDVIGSDFIIEERKHGIAIRRNLPERFASDPALTRRIGDMLVDTLSRLHTVDVAAAGLSELGRPEGYVERQLEGWTSRWTAARTRASADAAPLVEWLRDALPASPAATLVHNDYKLDNMLVEPQDPAQISALLDWDMCTVGDPLMDVGYLLALWVEPTDPPFARVGAMPTWHEGFATRREAAQRYARKTGFDITHLTWYHVFNLFRFAGILQQIYQRFERGQTHDARFARFGDQANVLVDAAAQLAGVSAPPSQAL